MQAPAECTPNAAGSNADPEYNNPTYQLFNASDNSLSPALALSILMESWPINSYPWLCVLPSGSVLIIAGKVSCCKDLDQYSRDSLNFTGAQVKLHCTLADNCDLPHDC